MNPINQLTQGYTPERHFLGLSGNEVLLLFGALTIVVAVLVVWAIYFRKPRTHGARYLTERPVHRSPEGSGRHRRRRRRREHRPRNPTLAETGGLPPARSGPSRF